MPGISDLLLRKKKNCANSTMISFFVFLACFPLVYAVQFGSYEELGRVSSSEVTENSGLAASRQHPGVLYGHNDKGDSSRIFALDPRTGDLLATLEIDNAANYDWEDICVGICGQGMDGYCIYIGDTGDHGGDGARNIIYKVREPTTIEDATLPLVDILQFQWDEPDAESLMVDPSGELYVISKVHGGQALFAKIPSSGWGAGHSITIPSEDTARLRISTTHNDPQGADISPNGEELLVKTEEEVFYYATPNRDYVEVVRTQEPQRVPYHFRPAGESIAWSATGSGFYTLPEGVHETFDWYPKL